MRRAARPRFVDLFAGAGLLSHAFAAEGFSPLRAVERDPVAAATCRENLGGVVEVQDVRRARPEGRCEVLVAGPPCQGYSSIGPRRSRDPRNLLCLEVVRWARAMRPLVVVVENVPRFLESPTWSLLAERLAALGYRVTSVVLEASDFGVPQHRVRSFTFATRAGTPVPEPPRLRAPRTVRDALADLSPRPDGRDLHHAPRPSPLALARIRLVPPGGDRRDILRRDPSLAPRSWLGLGSQATDLWGRLRWDRPANTLRTRFQNASLGRNLHPSADRVISLREGARLQSIPDGWRFLGLPTQVTRQIGNSVPPLLGRAVARAVRAALG